MLFPPAPDLTLPAVQRNAWGVARHMVLYDALYAALTAAGVQGVAPALAGGLARSCVVISLGADAVD